MPTQEIKYQAVNYTVALKVGEGLDSGLRKTWRLSDTTGTFILTLPQGMIPWAVVGEDIVVPIAFLQAKVVSFVLKVDNAPLN